MITQKNTRDVTPLQHFRAPEAMWKAFSAICKRRGQTAAADLNAHMSRTIRRYGSDEENGMLADAEAELRERRARKAAGRAARTDPAGGRAHRGHIATGISQTR